MQIWKGSIFGIVELHTGSPHLHASNVQVDVFSKTVSRFAFDVQKRKSKTIRVLVTCEPETTIRINLSATSLAVSQHY